MQFMLQTGSRYTVAKGCQHITCFQWRESTRGRWLDLHHRISPSILLPQAAQPQSPNPNICPSRPFPQVLNYRIPHPLLSTFTLVFSRLPSLPLLPHNLQPSGFFVQKPPGPSTIHLLRACHVLHDTNCLWAAGILKR